ncbi:MAG: alpha-glucosidase [Oscillospiraceae bacterium]|nr:alpha-glucosidase [Oscillospiraceae bacterium]
MLRSELRENLWTVSLDGKLALLHNAEQPFVTAVRREKQYKSNRGTVKETVTETARVPLTNVQNEGKKLVFTGEDHRFTVEIEEIEKGVRLHFSGQNGWAYSFRLPAIAGEAVFGGGEQYRKTNLRGEQVVNFVSEHIKVGTIMEKALLPRLFYKEKKHAAIGSYAPMPVFVTDTGRLIRFETAADGYARFGAEEYRFVYDSCPRSLTLVQGSSYRELVELLAGQIPNRQYLPDWCLDGMILGVQGGTQTVLEKTFAMLDAGAKICGVWSQDWSGCNRTVMGYQVWWNWETDQRLYPGLREAIAKLNARGVKFLAYINPYLVKGSRLYEHARERGYLITRRDGSVYHIKSTTFDAGMLDLTNPEAVSYIKETLIKQNMLELGVSGWMADFGEYLPLDCVLHDGDPHELHNLWPVLWARVNREAIDEYGDSERMFFMRSGYIGIQSYAPVLWNGDQHTDLTKDYGMPCVMPASFSLGFSGIPMVHCDIGGFFSFMKLRRDEELFIRWMEMCCFSLMMRSHESIRPWANAQFDADDVRDHTIRLTSIHRALKPYITHCVKQAQQGIPALRPDFWDAGSYRASRDTYSYYLGDELFVCPVIRKGARKRRVWLPKGEWIHFWSGKRYRGGRHTVPAPLGQIPVFFRKNSPYAMLFYEAAACVGRDAAR